MPPSLRRLLALVLVSLAARLAAADIVVFSRGDFRGAASAAKEVPGDPAEAAFLARAQADFSAGAPFDVTYPLINPPAWGRVVHADTAGRLSVRRRFEGGLVFHLNLERLEPAHTYVLCINGRPEHPGNELLPESVPGHEAEKYYDFFTVTTDAAGRYDGGFALLLKAGAYNVHFYVKDTTDHKIVLYGLEYFDFWVK